MSTVTTTVVDFDDVENDDVENGDTDDAVATDADASGAAELVDRLTDEVAHLRSCVSQILDLLEDQSDRMDDVALMADRLSVVERRMQRAERSTAR